MRRASTAAATASASTRAATGPAWPASSRASSATARHDDARISAGAAATQAACPSHARAVRGRAASTGAISPGRRRIPTRCTSTITPSASAAASSAPGERRSTKARCAAKNTTAGSGRTDGFQSTGCSTRNGVIPAKATPATTACARPRRSPARKYTRPAAAPASPHTVASIPWTPTPAHRAASSRWIQVAPCASRAKLERGPSKWQAPSPQSRAMSRSRAVSMCTGACARV